MHDVGSSIPFTESSSHNSDLIPIFLDQRSCMYMVPSFLIRVKQCPKEAFTHIVLDVHRINRMTDV
jgi:hypothetical protein